MDLAWWPGPTEYVVDLEAFQKATQAIGQVIYDAAQNVARVFNNGAWYEIGRVTSINLGTHDSGPAMDINVTGVKPVDDIHNIRERIAASLVADYDSSPELAEKAAMKVDQELVDDFEEFDDLVEHVYDTQSFWDE